jgi:hypothetical protein
MLEADEAPLVLHPAVVTEESWQHDVAAFGAVDKVEAVAEEVDAGRVPEAFYGGRDDEFVMDKHGRRGIRQGEGRGSGGSAVVSHCKG